MHATGLLESAKVCIGLWRVARKSEQQFGSDASDTVCSACELRRQAKPMHSVQVIAASNERRTISGGIDGDCIAQVSSIYGSLRLTCKVGALSQRCGEQIVG